MHGEPENGVLFSQRRTQGVESLVLTNKATRPGDGMLDYPCKLSRCWLGTLPICSGAVVGYSTG